MAVLNIEKIKFRNFRSYGDYDTELNINGLGPVLILGEIGTNPDKSNGAGKSTITDALIWCLFGRLPYKSRPADHVVHRGSGENCIVEITTCDGYVITRTRNHNGHSDLLIHQPDGQDISDSTNKNAQQHLNRLFDLDYEIFTAGTFFAQIGNAFLELPDQKRRKAMERMLHQDRYDHYVDACKEQLESLTKNQIKCSAEVDALDDEIIRTTKQAQQNVENKNDYETKRENKIEEQKEILGGIDSKYKDKQISTQNDLDLSKEQLAKIQVYDIDKLQKEWHNHDNNIIILDKMQESVQRIVLEVLRLETKKESILEHKSENSIEIIKETENKIQILRDEISQIDIANLPKLKIEWMEYEKEFSALNKDDADAVQNVEKIRAQIESEKEQINKWENQSGEFCPICEQEVTPEHIMQKCDSPAKRLVLLENKFKTVKEHQVKVSGLLECITMPDETVREAELINDKYKSKSDEIEQLEQFLETLEQKETENVGKETELTEEIKRKNAFVKKKNNEILTKKNKILVPEMTIREAQAIKSEYDMKTKEITLLKESIDNIQKACETAKQQVRDIIKQIKNEDNPYDKIIADLKKTLIKTKKNRAESNKKVIQYNKLIKHVGYIRSAYSDRRKIKAHILSKIIPYFNERITYYLDAFECNFGLKFTNALQTKSELWPYEMWSGGERKKIDLALMFAIHDLHISIYDQQCNILVFDEVDGRLDQDGIRKFTEILFNEMVIAKDGKYENAILVISHKDAMRDAFPSKILVKKDTSSEDGCSRIEEVR